MFGLSSTLSTIAGGVIGAAAAASIVLAWAVFSYGPSQYDAGGIAKAAELDAATNRAIGELTNEADRREFLFEQCRIRGGVYDFGGGVCVEG